MLKEAILENPNSEAYRCNHRLLEGELKDLSHSERKTTDPLKVLQVYKQEMYPKKFDETINKLLGVSIQGFEVGETIPSMLKIPENINDIGKAKIVKSKNDTGAKPKQNQCSNNG